MDDIGKPLPLNTNLKRMGNSVMGEAGNGSSSPVPTNRMVSGSNIGFDNRGEVGNGVIGFVGVGNGGGLEVKSFSNLPLNSKETQFQPHSYEIGNQFGVDGGCKGDVNGDHGQRPSFSTQTSSSSQATVKLPVNQTLTGTSASKYAYSGGNSTQIEPFTHDHGQPTFGTSQPLSFQAQEVLALQMKSEALRQQLLVVQRQVEATKKSLGGNRFGDDGSQLVSQKGIGGMGVGLGFQNEGNFNVSLGGGRMNHQTHLNQIQRNVPRDIGGPNAFGLEDLTAGLNLGSQLGPQTGVGAGVGHRRGSSIMRHKMVENLVGTDGELSLEFGR